MTEPEIVYVIFSSYEDGGVEIERVYRDKDRACDALSLASKDSLKKWEMTAIKVTK